MASIFPFRVVSQTVLFLSSDQDKLFKLDDRLAVVVAGESGDTTPFGEFIEKNVQLYKIRHGTER